MHELSLFSSTDMSPLFGVLDVHGDGNAVSLVYEVTKKSPFSLSVTSDNGSIRLLVQFLGGPDVEPLTGLHCTISLSK